MYKTDEKKKEKKEIEMRSETETWMLI